MTKSTGEDWLGVPAVARKLGLVLPTVYRILDSGELPAYKIGPGRVTYIGAAVQSD